MIIFTAILLAFLLPLSASAQFSSGSYWAVNNALYSSVRQANENTRQATRCAIDHVLVETTLNSKGIAYLELLAKVPKGTIGVVRNSDGQLLSISPKECSPKYTYL